MNRKISLLGLAALLAYPSAANCQATAGAAPVQLKASPPLGKNLGAFPRLVATPDDKAAQRINQALDRQEKQVLGAVKDCRENSQPQSDADYERSVSVTMRGPGYLSLVARDNWDCGGAHPDYSALILVYDLKTGSPVNWARLLPASTIQGTALDSAGDGTKIGVVSSRVLQDYYWKQLSSDAKNPVDPDCKEPLNDPDLKFNLWPDTKAGGIAIEAEGLPHAIGACADAVIVPTAVLRKMGVQAAMLDAIDTAHARGWYDPSK
jgi:hypothetical protein